MSKESFDPQPNEKEREIAEAYLEALRGSAEDDEALREFRKALRESGIREVRDTAGETVARYVLRALEDLGFRDYAEIAAAIENDVVPTELLELIVGWAHMWGGPGRFPERAERILEKRRKSDNDAENEHE